MVACFISTDTSWTLGAINNDPINLGEADD